MTGRSLDSLLALLGVDLDAESLGQLEWLAQELLRWNRTHNLTAITSPPEVRIKHLVDSLTLLPFLESTSRLLDLGSGAGFPSLPLKIARPALDVVSIDAVSKKIAFQRHVVRMLHLNGFTAIHGRAEILPANPAYAADFDVVTARALGSLTLLAGLAAPCLAPGGRLIAMKGSEGPREFAVCEEPLLKLGWEGRCHKLTLPETGDERSLIVLEHKI